MKKLFVLCFILNCFLYTFGQQAGPSALTAGGATSPTASGGTLTQAVGEMAVTTLQNNTGTRLWTQGVLQGAAMQADAIDPIPPGIFVNLFPNPAQQQIFLETNANFLHQIQIWDMMGREVRRTDLLQPFISLEGLAEGNYVLGLFDGQGQLRYTWRFVKF